MTSRVESYRAELRRQSDWDAYLKAHSGLPGPRGNLELLEAVGDEAKPSELWRLSRSGDEYLAACGAAGLGRLAGSDPKVLPRLRELASDPRWRVREGVAIGLQRFGHQGMPRLLEEMERWAAGGPYVQRAAAAGLCEPVLLKDPAQVEQVLAILDRITEAVASTVDRKGDAFRVLRQALGYCWSVAAAAHPKAARPLLERWFKSADPDVAWIMRANLAKARMAKLGPEWVAWWQRKLTTARVAGQK
jgi:hypothetical protein